jgi:hypothetical protein
MTPPPLRREYEELTIELREDPESPDSFRTLARLGRGSDSTPVEGRHTLGFSLREPDLALKALARSLRGGRLARRAESTTDAQFVGSTLFEALFGGALERLYTPLIERAKLARSNVRIRLMFPNAADLDADAAPRLASLPWEAMYDRFREDFVALMRGVSLVRGNLMPRIERGLTPGERLPKLLLVVSDLHDDRLGARREMAALQEVLPPETPIECLINPTPAGLSERLRETDAGIVHIVNTVPPSDPFSLPLSVEDKAPLDPNRPAWLPVRSLTGPGQLARTIQMIFLSACHSARMAAELSAVVPVAVGIQGLITIERGIDFARAFYGELVEGATVDDAIGEARRVVDRVSPGEHEWAVPSLVTDVAGYTPLVMRPNDEPVSFGSLRDDTEPEPDPRPLRLRARRRIVEANVAALEAVLKKVTASDTLKNQLAVEKAELEQLSRELQTVESGDA